MEYSGILIYITSLVQALQILVQMGFFTNILKFTSQIRFKVIPVHFMKAIGIISNLLLPPNKYLTSKQGYN